MIEFNSARTFKSFFAWGEIHSEDVRVAMDCMRLQMLAKPYGLISRIFQCSAKFRGSTTTHMIEDRSFQFTA